MQEKKENYKNQYKGLKFDHEKMEYIFINISKTNKKINNGIWYRLEFKDLTAKHGILENDQKEFANLKKLKMFIWNSRFYLIFSFLKENDRGRKWNY